MIEQFFIAATELIAIYLMQSEKYTDRKYSSIFGLLGQPFWAYASYTHEQWGSLFIGFFFTALWFKNFKFYWLNPQKQQLKPNEYHSLIMSAVDEVKSSKLDKKDYIDRVLKEALNIK
jgi:hypothetical protein